MTNYDHISILGLGLKYKKSNGQYHAHLDFESIHQHQHIKHLNHFTSLKINKPYFQWSIFENDWCNPFGYQN